MEVGGGTGAEVWSVGALDVLALLVGAGVLFELLAPVGLGFGLVGVSTGINDAGEAGIGAKLGNDAGEAGIGAKVGAPGLGAMV